MSSETIVMSLIINCMMACSMTIDLAVITTLQCYKETLLLFLSLHEICLMSKETRKIDFPMPTVLFFYCLIPINSDGEKKRLALSSITWNL